MNHLLKKVFAGDETSGNSLCFGCMLSWSPGGSRCNVSCSAAGAPGTGVVSAELACMASSMQCFCQWRSPLLPWCFKPSVNLMNSSKASPTFLFKASAPSELSARDSLRLEPHPLTQTQLYQSTRSYKLSEPQVASSAEISCLV